VRGFLCHFNKDAAFGLMPGHPRTFARGGADREFALRLVLWQQEFPHRPAVLAHFAKYSFDRKNRVTIASTC
jgi:hypothetical protein